MRSDVWHKASMGSTAQRGSPVALGTLEHGFMLPRKFLIKTERQVEVEGELDSDPEKHPRRSSLVAVP